jgi:hypothetical protein
MTPINEWARSVASIGICATVAGTVYFTHNPNALWAMLILLVLWGYSCSWSGEDKDESEEAD